MGRARKSKEGFDSSAWYKTRYEQRKADGLCVACGEQQSSSESVYCEGCLKKQRQRQQKLAIDKATQKAAKNELLVEQRIANGLCGGCGAEQFVGNLCRTCESIRLVNSGVTRYEARKIVGLCQNCDALVSVGEIKCPGCKTKVKVRHAKCKKDRICADCGKANDTDKSRCRICLDRKIKLYADRKTSGQCPHCGDDNPIAPGRHCLKCQKVNQEKDRRKYKKLRRQVLEAYGGKCMCPGCNVTTPEFLQIDHVNNDGAAHRRELFGSNKRGCSAGFYTWLRQRGFPKDGFQLLCANCNFAKSHGGCPHEKPQ